MSHITCQNGLVDRRKPMEELSFAEYLRKEMGLNDYQISKVQELLASFEQTEDTRPEHERLVMSEEEIDRIGEEAELPAEELNETLNDRQPPDGDETDRETIAHDATESEDSIEDEAEDQEGADGAYLTL